MLNLQQPSIFFILTFFVIHFQIKSFMLYFAKPETSVPGLRRKNTDARRLNKMNPHDS